MVSRKQRYVIARSASGRVTVQHRTGTGFRMTACGYDTSPWSVAFMAEHVSQIACRKPACKEGSC